MIPPAVDFILVRDALFHLPEYLVQEALSNINNSGAKYFATTTFSIGANGNWNSQRAYMDTNQDRTKMNLRSYIGYQKLNLYANPFNFPPPLFKVEDMTGDSRHVGIWSLPILPMSQNKHKEGSGLTLFDDILHKIYLLRGLSLFIAGVFVGVICMMTLGHNEIRRRQFIRYGSLVLLLICFLSVFFKLGIMIGEAIVVYSTQ